VDPPIFIIVGVKDLKSGLLGVEREFPCLPLSFDEEATP